jgi:hypothetical protein
MSSEYKGEIRLADGTLMGNAVDFQFEHEYFDPPKFDFREMFKPVEVKMEGTFTAGEGLNAFIDSMFSEVERESTVACYVSQQTLWMLQYAKQGKRYPSPKKRKSKAWRDRVSNKLMKGN